MWVLPQPASPQTTPAPQHPGFHLPSLRSVLHTQPDRSHYRRRSEAPQWVLVPENNTVPDSGFQADLTSPAATLAHVVTSCDCCSSYLLSHLLSSLPGEPAPGISRVPPLGPRSNVTSERWAATSLLSDLFKPAIVTSLCCIFIMALMLFIYLVGRSLSACSPG